MLLAFSGLVILSLLRRCFHGDLSCFLSSCRTVAHMSPPNQYRLYKPISIPQRAVFKLVTFSVIFGHYENASYMVFIINVILVRVSFIEITTCHVRFIPILLLFSRFFTFLLRLRYCDVLPSFILHFVLVRTWAFAIIIGNVRFNKAL